uniref:Protein kinase domain-containing protein n=1 Tax=Ascaris lumbricoides TaxID=6252 RepID=A0A0M3HL56_ASCLU
LQIAIKIIDTRKVTQEYRKKFLPREIASWRILNHHNIVALLAVFDEGSKVFLAMDLAENGDLVRADIQYTFNYFTAGRQ